MITFYFLGSNLRCRGFPRNKSCHRFWRACDMNPFVCRGIFLDRKNILFLLVLLLLVMMGLVDFFILFTSMVGSIHIYLFIYFKQEQGKNEWKGKKKERKRIVKNEFFFFFFTPFYFISFLFSLTIFFEKNVLNKLNSEGTLSCFFFFFCF